MVCSPEVRDSLQPIKHLCSRPLSSAPKHLSPAVSRTGEEDLEESKERLLPSFLGGSHLLSFPRSPNTLFKQTGHLTNNLCKCPRRVPAKLWCRKVCCPQKPLCCQSRVFLRPRRAKSVKEERKKRVTKGERPTSLNPNNSPPLPILDLH